MKGKKEGAYGVTTDEGAETRGNRKNTCVTTLPGWQHLPDLDDYLQMICVIYVIYEFYYPGPIATVPGTARGGGGLMVDFEKCPDKLSPADFLVP